MLVRWLCVHTGPFVLVRTRSAVGSSSSDLPSFLKWFILHCHWFLCLRSQSFLSSSEICIILSTVLLIVLCLISNTAFANYSLINCFFFVLFFFPIYWSTFPFNHLADTSIQPDLQMKNTTSNSSVWYCLFSLTCSFLHSF